MADPIEAGMELAKEASSKATNPVYVLGVAFLLLLCFGLYSVYYAVTSFGKPILDAQVQAVSASTDAIKTNAETQRQMSRTMEGIKSTQDNQAVIIESIRRDQADISAKCSQGLQDHSAMRATMEKNGGG